MKVEHVHSVIKIALLSKSLFKRTTCLMMLKGATITFTIIGLHKRIDAFSGITERAV